MPTAKSTIKPLRNGLTLEHPDKSFALVETSRLRPQHDQVVLHCYGLHTLDSHRSSAWSLPGSRCPSHDNERRSEERAVECPTLM